MSTYQCVYKYTCLVVYTRVHYKIVKNSFQKLIVKRHTIRSLLKSQKFRSFMSSLLLSVIESGATQRSAKAAYLTQNQEFESLNVKIIGAKVIFSVNIGSQLIYIKSGEDKIHSLFNRRDYVFYPLLILCKLAGSRC